MVGIVVAHEVTDQRAAFHFERTTFCGEPVLDPRSGYVMVEVFDGLRDRSGLAILRADHVEDGPVAITWLREPMPLSFHGVFSAA